MHMVQDTPILQQHTCHQQLIITLAWIFENKTCALTAIERGEPVAIMSILQRAQYALRTNLLVKVAQSPKQPSQHQNKGTTLAILRSGLYALHEAQHAQDNAIGKTDISSGVQI